MELIPTLLAILLLLWPLGARGREITGDPRTFPMKISATQNEDANIIASGNVSVFGESAPQHSSAGVAPLGDSVSGADTTVSGPPIIPYNALKAGKSNYCTMTNIKIKEMDYQILGFLLVIGMILYLYIMYKLTALCIVERRNRENVQETRESFKMVEV